MGFVFGLVRGGARTQRYEPEFERDLAEPLARSYFDALHTCDDIFLFEIAVCGQFRHNVAETLGSARLFAQELSARHSDAWRRSAVTISPTAA